MLEDAGFALLFYYTPSYFTHAYVTRTRFLWHAHIIQRFSCDLERPWDRNDENKLGNQLFQQIIQLWYLEKSQICLTTLQSSILLGIVMCASAQGRLGVRFIESGCDLALRIGVHTNDPECFAPNPLYDPDELRRAHKRIAWGIFDFQAYAYCTH